MNSFRHVEHAIAYEIGRQAEAIEAGERIVQETRLWDPDRGVTRSMRSKEHAHDYRYFPEPDLPPLIVPADLVEQIKIEMPELPAARRARYVRRDWAHGVRGPGADRGARRLGLLRGGDSGPE